MDLETWLLLVAVAAAAWLYSRWRHSYWSSRGVASPPALPFLGHFHRSAFVAKKPWILYQEAYSKYGGSTFCGLYELHKPVLMVGDPELMKLILIKDFDHFTDRRTFSLTSERDKPMSEMLSLKNGPEWKILRSIMTPIFTSGKMKGMFPMVCDKADALVNFSLKQAAKDPLVDMKNNFGRFTLDTIATCAFGIECNSLVNETAEFPRHAEAFFKPSLKGLIKGSIFFSMPKLFKFLNMDFSPPEMDFFVNVVNKTVRAREGGGAVRGDFLDLLLEARTDSDNPNSKHVLTDVSLVAQSVLFLVVGYDTTASTLAFAAHCLAKHKDQQQRLRQEVREMVAEHGEVSYQGVMESKLLDACIQETLRLYPPIPLVERKCSKTYSLPGTGLTLKPGDMVQFPVWSIHHDPRLWPNPEEFQPDRFMPQNKGDIKSFSHTPFGMGPRNCIAMRFAVLEAKVALAKLVLAAELETAPGHELVAEASGGILRPNAGFKLLLKPVDQH